MAKAVLTKGMLTVHDYQSVENTLNAIYEFIDKYRENPSRLSSFILTFNEALTFTEFENKFWDLIKSLQAKDKKIYLHDSRVSSDIQNTNFSFSLKSEAFFILALHPESPRIARRLSFPAIVFNPHQQFETLRNKGLFGKIRNLIRNRDKALQGFVNPMLSDFGEKSEIYQYTGRTYSPEETLFI
jgi:uncharacterized protein